MGAEAGWYADPSDSSQLRYWDGQAWSAHVQRAAATLTATPPLPTPNPYADLDTARRSQVPTRYGVATPPRRRFESRIAIAFLAAAAVVAGVLVWTFSGSSGSQHPIAGTPVLSGSYSPGCVTPNPVGASPSAQSYVDALNAASPAWTYVNNAYQTTGRFAADALRAQADGDGVFIYRLQHISFPGGTGATVRRLVTAVSTYRELILSDVQDPAHAQQRDARLRSAFNARVTASADLRLLLALPPATCNYDRPI